MSILWAINAYERAADLRFMVKQVKQDMPEVRVVVMCNCRPENISRMSGNGEDEFIHFPNLGHHAGTVDAMNRVVPLIRDEDEYVITSHADAHLTDVRIVRDIINAMSGKKAAVLESFPDGTFENRTHFGVPLDLFVMTNAFYKEMFPLELRTDEYWSEALLGNKLLARWDEVLLVPVKQFDRRTTHIRYNGLLDTDEAVLSQVNFVEKVPQLEKRYATLVKERLENP